MNILKSLSVSTLVISLLALSACEPGAEKGTETTPQANSEPVNETQKISGLPKSIDNVSVADIASHAIDEAGFMAHVNTLASDEFEGRAPATPGGEKTVAYIEEQYKKLGLKPAFGDSYRQAVPLMELNVTNAPALTLAHADNSKSELPYKESSVVFTSRTGESSEIKNSELVFVGYGVVAPEYSWNDYDGLDMAGKTAVILVNDPGYRQPEGDLFKGRTMTYYGRWTYKFEEAARQGAAGAIIVHEDGAAGYPWEVVSSSWSGPQYNLFSADGSKDNLAVESWITQSAAEDMFAKNELDYKQMVEQAGQADFKPVPLNSKVSTRLEVTSRQSDSYNVGAVVEGSTRPNEVFIYTAHWDHMGVKSVAEGEDAIFNGAQDNATGTAALLELAEAFMALGQAPERSVMFLAVTAEESGLLGSKQYAEDPSYPMGKTVAGVNIDSMSTIGETDDIVVVGFGNSQMDDYLAKAAEPQGRILVQEPTPEKGFFYRSDHFNLAKKGVPMLYAKSGIQVRGKPEGYGKAQSERYIQERYHKAADEVHAEWDNGGIMQDLNAYFRIGEMISNSNDWPQWSKGNEFKAIREATRPQ